MKILHITDFHYKTSSKDEYDQTRMIHSMVESLTQEDNFNFIFFTGDLVDKGSDKFKEAKERILDPILNSVGLDERNLFICEGNHDLDRQREMNSIRDTFEKINTNKELDSFVQNEKSRDYKESFENHKKFVEFRDSNFGLKGKDIFHPLYSIHKRYDDNNNKIGILTLNSSWRSFDSDTDRGNLLYPISLIKEQCLQLKGSKLNIVILHHLLSDFKDFNATVLEDVIHENFHVLLNGHVHTKKQSTHLSSDTGIFCCSSPSTLSFQDKSNETGYTILDIDVEDLHVTVENRIYSSKDNKFLNLPKQSVQIPINKTKKEQNDLRKTLKAKFISELEISNELLVNKSENVHDKNFLQLFSRPILKKEAHNEYKERKVLNKGIEFQELISTEGSYVISGKDKSGKTSILKKVQLELLNNFNTFKQLPIYINCTNLKKTDKAFDVIKFVANYYHLNRNRAKELIRTYHLKILIDNYDPTFDNFIQGLKDFFQDYNSTSFLAVAEETIAKKYETIKFGSKPHSNLFIHSITRKEVRELAKKWPNLSSDKIESILDRIGSIFIQLNIPMNYWTVSLLIWIHEKNAESNFHNNIDLINLYVDGILERNILALDKSSKINYEDYKVFIGELAHYLISNHHETSYSASYEEIIQFASRYKENNIRFVIEVEEIITLLVTRGIIKKIDGKYSFRLNGVFEYFVAYYMKDNQEFRSDVLKDSGFYLSFSNELELCSGFRRRDEEFLLNIYTKTQDIFKELNARYSAEGTEDRKLTNRINEAFDLTKPLKSIDAENLALQPEIQDEILTEFKPLEVQEAEVKRKEYYESIDTNPENLEKALFILCRVFRNSNVNNTDLVNEILDFILVASCNLGCLIIDEIGNIDPDKIEEGENETILLKLVTNFMPLIVQTFLFDSLAQNNLERLILSKIQRLEENSHENQFQLFLLYFLLIDLDIPKKYHHVDKLLEMLNIGVLSQTILIKLYFYIAFKCYNNSHLESSLINKLEKVHLKIDSKFDVEEFQRRISKQKRLNLIQRKYENK